MSTFSLGHLSDGTLLHDLAALFAQDRKTSAALLAHLAGRVEARAQRAKVAPLSPQRYELQVTLGQSMHDKLRYAQALLAHRVPSGDVAEVLERALDALIQSLEKRKFAASAPPRPILSRNPAAGRHVPAHVKRAVWERDAGQCTFTSEAGRRCSARSFLELDHIDEFARGGQATVAGMRVRCRARNQYAAERAYGAEFMNHKRREAEAARAAAKTRKAEAAERDVIPYLRALRYSTNELRRAAAYCETLPDVSPEDRVLAAIQYLGRTKRLGRRLPAGAHHAAPESHVRAFADASS